MADIPGKAVILKVGDGGGPEVFTTVAAALSNAVSINNSPVEFNTKDSAFRKLFPTGSIKSATITGNYQFINSADQDRLKTVAFAADSSLNIKLVDGSGEEIDGNFQITTFDLTGEAEGYASFDITLESNGTFTLQAET